ncbi:hypothetical protein VPNG_03689 [Cytospora leucostoma]|uniref:AB hydrolase-1 domain-containing protein n=1 Tax=Cytospora leucostoma TaxID=1230097 RepID=A0A423XF13_9PEZI|nr:hypothetical protein VPNG_03689 [Cytospora leucostoma]
MANKPTFIFVPGAWHTASTWEKVTSLLDLQGYKSTSVTLPSTTGDPNATFLDDLQAVREAILSETTQGHNVILAVHSYGGHVGESALQAVPTTKNPGPEPTNGRVIGIAMMATGFNLPNMAFMDGLGGQPPPTWRADTESGFAVFTDNPPPAELFYHDLPAPEAEAWSLKLTKQSLKALFEGGEYAYAGWKDVPCWFLLTTEDRALPVDMQRMLIGMAREASGSVEVREISSGHCPMLSKPEDTANFLVEAATALSQ